MNPLAALYRNLTQSAGSTASGGGDAHFSFRSTVFRGQPSELPATAGLDHAGGVDSELMAEFNECRPRLRYQAELTAEAQAGTKSHAVVYVSKSRGTQHEHEQLRALRAGCALRNFQAGISSAIVLQDGMFCQWLQGEEDAVESLLARIKRDARHTALMTLYRGPAPVCMLDSWSMALRSLYMGQGNAFARAQLLRYKVSEAGYSRPLDAWTDFTGVTSQAKTIDGQAATALGGGLGEPVTLLGLRSHLGGQMLLAAAKGEQSGLGVTRWASALDANCDLQALGGLLPLGERPAYLAAISVRALRVAAVREAIRHRRRVVITLSQADSAELECILSHLEDNTPSDFAPTSVTVLAPEWTKDAHAHALHLVKLRNWRGHVHALDMGKRNAWQQLGTLIPA